MSICNLAVKVPLALLGLLFLISGNRALATQWVLHRTYEAKEVKQVSEARLWTSYRWDSTDDS